MQNGTEEFLTMRNMDEEIPSESTTKYDHLFMDWVNKNITEIEDQRCIRIACTGEGFSHQWKMRD